MPFVIRDGYTETDEFPGQHWIPKFKFSYRPVLSDRYYEYRAVPKENGKQVFQENAKLIREHLVSWDVTDEAGMQLDFKDSKVLARVPPPVIAFIVDCLCSYGPDRAKLDAKNSD